MISRHRRPNRSRPVWTAPWIPCSLLSFSPSFPSAAANLAKPNIHELNIPVAMAEPLPTAPATLRVITQDDARRSGRIPIPVLLRTVSCIDVTLEDIDRIEVAKGPRLALGGLNVVSGVINFVSRNSRDCQNASVVR